MLSLIHISTAEELESFEPDFVVYNASKAKVENYKELGLNSETAVMFNICLLYTSPAAGGPCHRGTLQGHKVRRRGHQQCHPRRAERRAGPVSYTHLIISFTLSVAAGVVSYYICKWLDDQFKAGKH